MRGVAVLAMAAVLGRAVAFVAQRGAAAAPRGLARRSLHMSEDVAFMFPGQGAQYIGMAAGAKDLPAAAKLFETASSILGYDLLERCTSGPKDVLDSTEVSQPAIFVASMAALEKLKAEEGEDVYNSATVAMGLSLGEYSALCYAGVFSFEDGVKLTKARGQAMQQASDAADSGMLSVIGLDSETVGKLCETASEQAGAPIAIANYLCPGNYAVSGAAAAVDVVEKIAKSDFKARMTVRLAVAGAFHTDFMAPAVEPLSKALAEVEFKAPRIPVISNVDAKAHSDPEEIKKILTQQVTSPVQWETTMNNLVAAGFTKGYEVGPNKVISGIMRRVQKSADMTNVEV